MTTVSSITNIKGQVHSFFCHINIESGFVSCDHSSFISLKFTQNSFLNSVFPDRGIVPQSMSFRPQRLDLAISVFLNFKLASEDYIFCPTSFQLKHLLMNLMNRMNDYCLKNVFHCCHWHMTTVLRQTWWIASRVVFDLYLNFSVHKTCA